MNIEKIKTILESVHDQSASVDEALERLRNFPSESLSEACIDNQRQLRTGIPEVIYGAAKSADQIIAIAKAMLAHGGPVVATRVDREKADAVCVQIPEFTYHPRAAMLIARPIPTDEKSFRGRALVVCAGTSDLGVAEEARMTLSAFGHPVDHLYDAGVAGLHRLLHRQELLRRASVIVVVAGMEGALPSVVSGLVDAPVIAVPTSVGYGAAFGGIAALLAMLNSCAPGIAVVNIDNGFGGACMAHAINRNRP